MAPAGASPRYDAILGELLAALEEGELPGRAELLARHPGSEATVERVLAAVGRYAELRQGAAHRPELGPLLAPGETLGDFAVEALLAEGGMGRVYRARQRSLGERVVALKVFARRGAGGAALPQPPAPPGAPHARGALAPAGPGDAAADAAAVPDTARQAARARARFQREALAASSLHHPHLAEVYGFGEERGLAFYAMRLVGGPTLRELLERLASEPALRLDPEVRHVLVRRAAEVASALAAIHAAGLVHRDVKPSNVLLEDAEPGPTGLPEACAVLVDFGLARSTQTDTLTLTRGAGTEGYASPEQLLGRRPTPASDVFSLGVTLHDLLTGRRPAERGPASHGMRPLAELVPGVDPDLAAVVARACDPAAEWRYPDGAALRDDLEAWLAGEPVAARRLGVLERVRRLVQRHPQRLLKGIAALAAAAVLALALTSLAGVLRAAGRAADARERGDVPALARTLAAIPAPASWILPWDRELRACARRLDAAAPDDPLVAIVSHLRDEHPTRAIETAATHMRLHGVDDDPLVRDWLVGELRPGAGSEERRSTALVFLTRLFYERDDQAPDELAARRPFRLALLDLWRTELAPKDRLYVLAALSGCAELGDLPEILEWAFVVPAEFTEPQRIALRCAERTVRRANRLDLLGEGPLEGVWRCAVPHLRRLYPAAAHGGLMPGIGGIDLCRFTIALVFARRRALGEPLDLSGLVSEEERDRILEPPLPPGAPSWMSVFAAAGDARVADVLLRETPLKRSDPRESGELCAALADPDVTAAVRSRWSDFPSPGREAALVAFQRGYEATLAEHHGRVDRLLLDPESRLGAEVGPSKELPLLEVDDVALGGPSLATWLFRPEEGHPLACGLAGPVRGRQAFFEEVESSYDRLRLPSAGVSEVLLDFEIPPGWSTGNWELVLWHVKPMRVYLPYLGETFVDVALDGALLAEALTVDAIEGQLDILTIRGERLTPGRHTLGISLAPRSTAMYWLLLAAVRPQAPPGTHPLGTSDFHLPAGLRTERR